MDELGKLNKLLITQSRINDMQHIINQANGKIVNGLIFRIKRLEDMCEGFADVVYGDEGGEPRETPTGLGILTSGNFGGNKRFTI